MKPTLKKVLLVFLFSVLLGLAGYGLAFGWSTWKGLRLADSLFLIGLACLCIGCAVIMKGGFTSGVLGFWGKDKSHFDTASQLDPSSRDRGSPRYYEHFFSKWRAGIYTLALCVDFGRRRHDRRVHSACPAGLTARCQIKRYFGQDYRPGKTARCQGHLLNRRESHKPHNSILPALSLYFPHCRRAIFSLQPAPRIFAALFDRPAALYGLFSIRTQRKKPAFLFRPDIFLIKAFF